MYKNVRLFTLIVLIFLPFLLFPQAINSKTTDVKSGKEILCGNCDRSGLEKDEFGRSFKEYYSVYEPDKTVLRQLKMKDSGLEIVIVLGTWCSDSREQVPRFFKILDKIHFNKNNIQVICVDRDLKACGIDLDKYDIKKVPTFIIYDKGREIGRIIETPYSTLEKDLLMFFSEN